MSNEASHEELLKGVLEQVIRNNRSARPGTPMAELREAIEGALTALPPPGIRGVQAGPRRSPPSGSSIPPLKSSGGMQTSRSSNGSNSWLKKYDVLELDNLRGSVLGSTSTRGNLEQPVWQSSA